MSSYRVAVRIELINEDTGRAVTYDNQDYYFEARQGAQNGPYDAVRDAVANAIAALEVEGEASENEGGET